LEHSVVFFVRELIDDWEYIFPLFEVSPWTNVREKSDKRGGGSSGLLLMFQSEPCFKFIGKEREVVAMEMGGNKRVNDIFEARLGDTSKLLKPSAHSGLPMRGTYVVEKYQTRAFLDLKTLERISHDILHQRSNQEDAAALRRLSDPDIFRGMSKVNLFSDSKRNIFGETAVLDSTTEVLHDSKLNLSLVDGDKDGILKKTRKGSGKNTKAVLHSTTEVLLHDFQLNFNLADDGKDGILKTTRKGSRKKTTAVLDSTKGVLHDSKLNFNLVDDGKDGILKKTRKGSRKKMTTALDSTTEVMHDSKLNLSFVNDGKDGISKKTRKGSRKNMTAVLDSTTEVLHDSQPNFNLVDGDKDGILKKTRKGSSNKDDTIKSFRNSGHKSEGDKGKKKISKDASGVEDEQKKRVKYFGLPKVVTTGEIMAFLKGTATNIKGTATETATRIEGTGSKFVKKGKRITSKERFQESASDNVS
jgi:hypothetical protein